MYLSEIKKKMKFHDRCLKTINSKKYGVDLVCFTDNPAIVLYSSKNGWDGNIVTEFPFYHLFILFKSMTDLGVYN